MPMRRRRADDAVVDESVELAALADGSLSGERRSQLEARVAASPDLSARLAEQEQALALTRTAVAEVETPEALLNWAQQSFLNRHAPQESTDRRIIDNDARDRTEGAA